MHLFSLASGQPYSIILPFISLAITMVTVIIGLNCIWRVEKRLDTFMKVLTIAVSILGIKKVFNIIGFVNSNFWAQAVQYLDVATALLFLIAFVEMYRIIRALTREQKN